MSRTNRASHRIRFARADRESARETHRSLVANENSEDHASRCEEYLTNGPGSCDCYQSETVMLSFGYAEVYQSGEVVAFGQVLHTFDSDSDDTEEAA